MGVSGEFDCDLRGRLSAEFAASLSLVDLDAVDAGGPSVWMVGAASPAAADRGIETLMWEYVAAELDGDGTLNLPLTQARALLSDAAGSLVAVGRITTDPDEAVRFAAIGPLARSCAERAALVGWVLSGVDRDQRLRRALVVEVRGVENLLRYLPDARADHSADDLQRMRTRLLDIASSEAGGYLLNKKGDTLDVGGERQPTLTELVTAAAGPSAYAELSVYTHPTAHLRVASSEWSRGGHRQVAFVPRSTVHDEGRLCESAVLAFAKAVATVAHYIGAPGSEIAPWVTHIADLWVEWCTLNGCR